MYSRSSEPVRFERDCPAVMVPQGENVTLPAGSIGYITQALGGSWTVFVEGNLFRIAGRDADAIGKEPPLEIELPDGAGDEDVESDKRWVFHATFAAGSITAGPSRSRASIGATASSAATRRRA